MGVSHGPAGWTCKATGDVADLARPWGAQRSLHRDLVGAVQDKFFNLCLKRLTACDCIHVDVLSGSVCGRGRPVRVSQAKAERGTKPRQNLTVAKQNTTHCDFHIDSLYVPGMFPNEEYLPPWFTMVSVK